MRKWTLSEFLNLLELRSQYWCYVEMYEGAGFNVAHSENILFYAALDGTVDLYGTAGESIHLNQGDILMVMSGEPHAICTEKNVTTHSLEYLEEGMPVDTPVTFTLGSGARRARLLCGRLKVRWPFGQRPRVVPNAFKVAARESPVNLFNIEQLMVARGGASVLTRTASLIVTIAFQSQSDSEAGFLEFVTNNPIDCVKQYIDKHPFYAWSVEILARRVGMGRSTLAARFSQEAGMTPMEYVTFQRMRLAEKLLQNSDLKISDISQRVGYRSEAAFSRRFTLHFGMSPGRMRKQLQGQHMDGQAAARNGRRGGPNLRGRGESGPVH